MHRLSQTPLRRRGADNALPLYQQIADRLESAIRRQAFRAGHRMPSVRQVAREQRVSIPTALQAYAALELRGWVEARPKSGFYVRMPVADRIPEMAADSAASQVSDLAATDPLDLIRSDDYDPRKVQLGAAVPSPELLPGRRLARILSSLARDLGAKGANYGPLEGPLSLRREIARRSLAAGLNVGPADLCITLGATEAVALALRAVCAPGDTVVVESPTFFGLLRQLREMGLRALPIPVDAANGMDLDALAAALKKTRVAALLVIPSFHNPVGFAMPDDRKQALVQIATARGIPIIEDDLYGDMAHQGVRPRAVKAFDRDGSVLYCSSFSKSIAPGYRVGYIAAGKWQRRVLALKKIGSGGNPLLPALAVAEFLTTGGYDRYMRSFRQSCRQQVALMRDAIGSGFPPEIRLSRPAGGYVLWCELPSAVDSIDLFHRARAVGIYIAPGPMFSPDFRFRNFIRINCGYPWSDKIAQAIKTLGQLICGS
jgi:DNA-binding transcriptional MocR family regulator